MISKIEKYRKLQNYDPQPNAGVVPEEVLPLARSQNFVMDLRFSGDGDIRPKAKYYQTLLSEQTIVGIKKPPLRANVAKVSKSTQTELQNLENAHFEISVPQERQVAGLVIENVQMPVIEKE